MPVLITYLIYSLGLYGWSLCSIQYDSAAPAIRYGAASLLLIVFVWWCSSGKKKQIHSVVVTVMGIFMNIALSVAYGCTSDEAQVLHISDLKDTYAGQTVVAICVFIIVYGVTRYTRVYKMKLVNLVVALVTLVIAFGARITGEKLGGSYLYFKGIMVFSFVLFCFPFISANLIAEKEDAYVGKNVRNLSWNLFILLGYTCLLYMASVLNTEYGLVLILGASMCVLFYLRCKNMVTKLFYTGICAVAGLTAMEFVPHIHDRVLLWIDPVTNADTAGMKEKAEAVLYLFRYLKNMGYYGRGLNNLRSSRRIPTYRSDHVLLTIANDYSLLLVVLVILLSLLLVRQLLSCPKGVEVYDYFLNLSIALVVGFTILINLGSVGGSFLQAGISFPWLSASGGQNNLMFTGLLAVHCGIAAKGDDTT